MIKKTITFTDYNGLERTEDHYFNLSKTEIVEMENGVSGGFTAKMRRIIAAQDTPTIMAIFKDLILKSYGQKSDDGRRFIKSETLSEEFSQTEAFSQLYIELATDADTGAKFINGLLPADLAKEVAKAQANGLSDPMLANITN